MLRCLSEPNLFLGSAEGSDFEVLFVFGPSVRRPREAYLIRAHARAAGEEEPAVDRAARGLLTRVNRKLVTAIMEAEESRRGGGPSAGGRRGGALQRERNKGLGSNPKAHVLVRRREPAPIGAGFDGFFPQPGVDAEAMDPVVVVVGGTNVRVSVCTCDPAFVHVCVRVCVRMFRVRSRCVGCWCW